MQVKFDLSKDTKAHLRDDGVCFSVQNKTGMIVLQVSEIEELSKVPLKAWCSLSDMPGGEE